VGRARCPKFQRLLFRRPGARRSPPATRDTETLRLSVWALIADANNLDYAEAFKRAIYVRYCLIAEAGMGQSTMAATQEIRVSTAQPGQFPMNCCYSAPARRRAWVSRYSRQLRRRELRNSLKCLLNRLAFTCRNTNFSKSCNKLCQVKIVCLVLVWIRLKPPSRARGTVRQRAHSRWKSESEIENRSHTVAQLAEQLTLN
jgi:hypothetical protein